MSIVAPLPNNIHNGDALDAVPVMANFNQIVSNVNSNAADLNAQNTFSQPQNGVNAILSAQFTTLQQVQALILAAMPTGTVVDFAGTVAPAGWQICDGTALSRVTQSNLFNVIGTTWGAGNGTTTFNVPDLRRRVTMGAGGTGTGTIGAAVGNIGGEENHTLAIGEIPSHNHGVNDPSHNHSVNDPSHGHIVTDPGHNHGVNDPGHNHGYTVGSNTGGNLNSALTSPNNTVTNTTNTGFTGISLNASGTGVGVNGNVTGISLNGAFTGITIQANGGSGAHNTIQPSAVMNKIIKL